MKIWILKIEHQRNLWDIYFTKFVQHKFIENI